MELPATLDIVWIGKHSNGHAYTIASTPSYLASLLLGLVAICTKGHEQQRLRKFLGRVLWASRPGHAAVPVLAGAYTWLTWGSANARHTPKAVARGITEAIAINFTLWRAARTPTHGERWFVDAAPFKSVYVIGHTVGYRLSQAPAGVRSHQVAELYGLQRVIKLVAYRHCQDVEILGDNLATLQQVVHQCARVPLRPQQRILRRIHHTMRWSGVAPRIYWGASE